jgi:predicted Zn-dependent protease
MHMAGAFGRAVTHYDSVLAVQADHPEALWGRARVLADSASLSGDSSAAREAEEAYRQAVRLRSGVAELRLDYARMLLTLRRQNDAAMQISEAEALIPGDPLVVSYRAWLTGAAGDTAEARRLLASALTADPVPDETLVLASLFGVEGRPDLQLLLGRMGQTTPGYAYNPRRYRYETVGLLRPWYLALLRERIGATWEEAAD